MVADFDFMCATQMRDLVRRKVASPVELTLRALDKAKAAQGSLNAFHPA